MIFAFLLLYNTNKTPKKSLFLPWIKYIKNALVTRWLQNCFYSFLFNTFYMNTEHKKALV